MANGMVYEALQFQRQRSTGSSSSSAMLSYFFERADELGKLDSVLQLSLTQSEDRELVNFLGKSPSKQEVLLMYYLQRSRYAEAVALNERLNSEGNRSDVRKAIMERFCKANLIPNAVLAR